jgi:hypothetical protein
VTDAGMKTDARHQPQRHDDDGKHVPLSLEITVRDFNRAGGLTREQ